MSKIDETYIRALGTFTDALAEIVETLKEQQNAGNADVVNDFLKTNLPPEYYTLVENIGIVPQTDIWSTGCGLKTIMGRSTFKLNLYWTWADLAYLDSQKGLDLSVGF